MPPKHIRIALALCLMPACSPASLSRAVATTAAVAREVCGAAGDAIVERAALGEIGTDAAQVQLSAVHARCGEMRDAVRVLDAAARDVGRLVR